MVNSHLSCLQLYYCLFPFEEANCNASTNNHKCKHEHHHADEIFTSWSKQTPKKYTKIQLETILKKLSENSNYGNILRAKGYVDSFENNWLYFDLVPGEYEIRIGKANFTGQICIIGEKLDEQKLNNLFDEVA